MGICSGILTFVAEFVIGIVGISSLTSAGGIIITLIFYAALSGIAYGLSSISIALIYARLRQIKEGVSIDQIVSVFD